MSLTPEDIRRLGELARIRLDEDEQTHLLAELDDIFAGVIEKLRAIDTTGVEPMTHPEQMGLRLRDDAVTETDQRAENQRSAPAVAEGLFLVPRVVE
ncbi:MAG: Asp-tRNA(Asn)/Glu-tRNA(Gln) amidotransferase subunit GatC [Lautropia sp.]|nr:Asp-tRNA(Asn)/Glu-tRNA(Gln) amidotransferase subunit GatC [Lautropia sp.]